jgi:hypothetical protein
MKKSFVFTGVIFAAIILIELISVITNNINPAYVYAFDPTYPPSPICYSTYQYYTSPNLVNDFDNNHGSNGCTMQAPPIGSEIDYLSWVASQALPPPQVYPTPIISSCGNGTCDASSCPPLQYCFPASEHSEGYMRIEWTGQNYYSPQFIQLAQPLFENDNCDGTTYPSPCGTPSGNWTKYGYLRYFAYYNYVANSDSVSVSQTVSLYDGNITVTSGAITVGIQGTQTTVLEPWKYHVSVSLNAFANHYDTTTGRYFSVSNIADVIIPAPMVYYTGLATIPTFPSAFSQSPASNSLIMYYDYLTLGASTDLPYYDSPQNESVKTAYNTPGFGVNPIGGALIEWTALGVNNTLGENAADYATANNTYSSVSLVPVTAYHIYRSLAHSAGVGPYISVGFATGSYASPGSVTMYTDTTCPGGDTFCYKILACNNGPTGDWNNEKTNTINASYNEPLLNATNVAEICGYVIAPATPTPTYTPVLSPTITPTYCSNCATATPTFIPSVVGTPNPTEAYVYPNPFNPNGSVNGGDKVFHVGNVADGTQIHIYSMDGSLVYDGTYTTATGGFTWDGTNKNSSKVVSGLYYLVLKDPKTSKTAVFRIIVCYKCDPVYKPQ